MSLKVIVHGSLVEKMSTSKQAFVLHDLLSLAAVSTRELFNFISVKVVIAGIHASLFEIGGNIL